ncbi:MAG: ABC transporter ATP-binding protein [Clostridiales Family XIII bacterium]|jgi:peptide/nickel transport system ATP-binding protein|nr:ABC transporter ATP-binding protein [Clostridiales Family XIII bacterium]
MDEIILYVKNFSVTFPGKKAVRGVSLDLRRGELLALVGESGSGKTVLCRSLLGLPGRNATVGYDLLERPAPAEMSLVMQNAVTALDPAMPVGKQIAEAARAAKGGGAPPAELLARVGIDNPKLRQKQYPSHFSGGMCQRVAIAAALAMNPKIIFADEPTTSLDADIRMRVMELLFDICKNSDVSILFVTHDLALVKDFADRVLIMKDGEIVERGTADGIFKSPREAYTRELLDYAAHSDPAHHTHGKIHYHDLHLHSHSHSHEGTHTHTELVGTETADDETPPEKALISVRNLSKYYPLGRGKINRVLKNISLDVYPGEIVGLCGPSGAGKSTLARCLTGIERPSGGTRITDGDLNIQMIFQDASAALNPRMTAEEIIAEPLLLRDGKNPPRSVVLDLMARAELSHELTDRRPRELSGGQRQRVAIARAIATNPRLIIADEPVSSLDAGTCSKIIHLLRRIKDDSNLSVLLISHDLSLLAHVSDRILRIR